MRGVVMAVCSLMLSVGVGTAAAQSVYDSTAAITRARELTQALSHQDAATLWTAFDSGMRSAMKDSASFVGMLGAIVGQTGAVEKVLSEKAVADRGLRIYLADVRCKTMAETGTLMFAFDSTGHVSGMFIRPQKPAPRREYASAYTKRHTLARLRLPFDGEWTVIWGGHSIEQNYHAMTRDQRFAHDLVMLKNGSSHKGDGRKLTDYYCYGQPILAPADGEIVWQRDSLPDQAIGSTDAANAIGNGVVIDHATGEFSVIAHLQPGSLRVKLGQQVKAGDVIGLTGNSGNTSEPHLHYHLQSGPRPLESEGFPAEFTDLIIDGQPAALSEIVKGQRVRPGGKTARR